MLAGLAVIALQTAFVAALLIQRHRRRRAELLLKESEERMTFTAASANIGLWQYNPESQELWATEHCCTLFGLARDVPLTRDSFLKAVHPEDRELADLRTAEYGKRRPAGGPETFASFSRTSSIRWVRVRAQTHPGGGAEPRPVERNFSRPHASEDSRGRGGAATAGSRAPDACFRAGRVDLARSRTRSISRSRPSRNAQTRVLLAEIAASRGCQRGARTTS